MPHDYKYTNTRIQLYSSAMSRRIRIYRKQREKWPKDMIWCAQTPAHIYPHTRTCAHIQERLYTFTRAVWDDQQSLVLHAKVHRTPTLGCMRMYDAKNRCSRGGCESTVRRAKQPTMSTYTMLARLMMKKKRTKNGDAHVYSVSCIVWRYLCTFVATFCYFLYTPIHVRCMSVYVCVCVYAPECWYVFLCMKTFCMKCTFWSCSCCRCRW